MADPDDAAALRAHGEAASDALPADQFLHAPATATASGGSGSAERRTSGVLKLAPRDSIADAVVVAAGVAAEAEPNSSGRLSVRNRDAIPSTRSTPAPFGELELTALRLELARVRQTLEEGDNEQAVDGVTTAEDLVTASAAVSTDDSDSSDVSEFRVLAFGGGTYRGQARLHGQLEQSEWEPHGLGVLTTSSGHTYCGQWLNGTQVGHGTRYGPALHYEGDVSVAGGTAVPATGSCYGVGLYTFGALFVGCWGGDVTLSPPNVLHPRGLGSLQSSADTLAVDGWCHGLRCAHQCPTEMDPSSGSFRLPAGIRLQDQPLRGLLVADEKLQLWRRRSLTRALSVWARLCCDFNITQAKRSRLLALSAQARARRAEQIATLEDIDRQKAARSDDAADLLALLAKSREAQEQRSQRRHLYAHRLASAIKQRDLAQACVVKQQSAVKPLELELQEVEELLTEARQAQEHCSQCARELRVLKRQVENASVKLNAVRFDQQRNAVPLGSAQQQQESQLNYSQRSVPLTPVKKTPRLRQDATDNNSMLGSRDASSVTLDQQFVCDVPGCMCGIPRDVFLRVGAALNDE
ncbi:hypothetical protein PF005_g14749 [Phytophthora fragariae]|uniref:Uncharacterized protein n=1 Tax=Phytophthora fragariae TaxID=53985 RepID=A0A6A3RSA3_9STRA|nr:hypothetical protein PF003_g8241 [Phytophthora fragariae]KAE8933584.1 hypothetical protein PF009_g16416 [Phytophthora fragariae]KAE9001473.1 hypothetical protein PF011_g13731 [Phytophthora fragariae]KAE9101294.1 hypothetical protein PF010_g14505 [Phytophthora fragariae]KAE9101635.1 hypothetical protein PF007_g15070 [Phytophthora fragariae]